MENQIEFIRSASQVNWEALKRKLVEDDFDNGRTPDQLRRSFENSFAVCFALSEGEVIGKARVLSDGVGNAYLLDVWTLTAYRNRGVAREMIRRLKESLPGQHVYLQSDDDTLDFYEKLGFRPQPNGMHCIVGEYLNESS